ncbi:MAG TPA: SDR family oxidoreductase [Candidatus Binataceae bacterium]
MPTALITGASSGLGEQFAYALGREHYDLVLAARREDRLAAVAGRARTAGAGIVRVVRADLAVAEGAAALHQQLAGDGVQIDYLVNNAGFGTSGSFHLLPLERELEQIQLNVTSLVAMTRLVLPAMVERRRGTVINVASTAAFQATPYMATYGATKAFVLSFSEAVAAELRGTGVTVMAFCPGPVHTEFQKVANNERMHAPSFMWTQADQVVSQAIAAAASGRSVCVAGALNNVMVIASKLAPRALSTFVASTMMRPSSVDKTDK